MPTKIAKYMTDGRNKTVCSKGTDRIVSTADQQRKASLENHHRIFGPQNVYTEHTTQ